MVNITLAFMQRNLARYHEGIKAQCYQTLVEPMLESPCMEIEAVQRRTAS